MNCNRKICHWWCGTNTSATKSLDAYSHYNFHFYASLLLSYNYLYVLSCFSFFSPVWLIIHQFSLSSFPGFVFICLAEKCVTNISPFSYIFTLSQFIGSIVLNLSAWTAFTRYLIFLSLSLRLNSLDSGGQCFSPTFLGDTFQQQSSWICDAFLEWSWWWWLLFWVVEEGGGSQHCYRFTLYM